MMRYLLGGLGVLMMRDFLMMMYLLGHLGLLMS
jgi:hypothetical protein